MSSTNVPVTQAPPESAEPETSSTGSMTATPPSTDSVSGATGSSAEFEPADSAGSSEPSGSLEPTEPAVPSEPDELAAAAVDLARQAAVEIAEPNTVGEHLGVTVDDGGLTMHSFRCTARGYRVGAGP